MTDKYVSQFLDTNGDGTGTIEANGNYSSAEEIFFIQPPSGRTYSLFRVVIWIKYPGVFDADRYGDTLNLTHGIDFRVFSGQTNTYEDLLSGQAIMTNGDWASRCFSTEILVSESPGHSVFLADWEFSKAAAPLLLHGRNNDRVEVVLNDDFSGLSGHRFLVHFSERVDLFQ